MIKILICTITYNRPEGLKKLLESLQKQIVNDDVLIEICVVDNACQKQTLDVVHHFQNHSYKINALEEPQIGIVFARNKAVEYFLSSDFDFMAFIDDDEWTGDESWLSNLLRAKIDTGADIVTSDVFSIPENDKIEWTVKAMDRQKSLGNLSKVNRFYTGNVLLSRHVLETICPAFDQRFALTGSSDLHFCLKCQKAGYKTIYTDMAPAFEMFPESRANIKWFFMRGFRNGSGSTRSEIYISQNIFKTVMICLGMAGLRFMKSVLFLFKALLKWDKGLYATGIMRMASSFGTVLGLFGLKYNEYKTIHGK